MNEPASTATVVTSTRFEGDLNPSDKETILLKLEPLNNRLKSFPPDGIELILSMKERGKASQRTTLEAIIPGGPRLIATSVLKGLDEALIQVRDELNRQITDHRNQSEPRQNRSHRDSVRNWPEDEDE